jgi:hypothetical protein
MGCPDIFVYLKTKWVQAQISTQYSNTRPLLCSALPLATEEISPVSTLNSSPGQLVDSEHSVVSMQNVGTPTTVKRFGSGNTTCALGFSVSLSSE